jgi:hypothetical protein
MYKVAIEINGEIVVNYELVFDLYYDGQELAYTTEKDGMTAKFTYRIKNTDMVEIKQVQRTRR